MWWYLYISRIAVRLPNHPKLDYFRIGNHGIRAPPNLGNSTDGRFPSPFYIAINGRVRFLFSNCRWCLSSIIRTDRAWFRWKFSNPSHGWYFGCLLSGQTYMVPKSSISNQIQKGYFEVVPLLIVISGEILVLSSNNGRTCQTQTWRISRFKKNWHNSNLMHCASWMRNCYYYKIHLNPWVPYSPKQSKGLLWIGRCSCSLPWLILRVLLFGSPFSGGVALREGPGHSCCCLAFQYWSCNYMCVCRAGAIPDTLHHEPLTSKDAASGKFKAANPNLICWIPTWRSHAAFAFPIEDLGLKKRKRFQCRIEPNCWAASWIYRLILCFSWTA